MIFFAFIWASYSMQQQCIDVLGRVTPSGYVCVEKSQFFGLTCDANGAAISVDNELCTLTVRESTFMYCRVVIDDLYGGAIFFAAGNTGSRIELNRICANTCYVPNGKGHFAFIYVLATISNNLYMVSVAQSSIYHNGVGSICLNLGQNMVENINMSKNNAERVSGIKTFDQNKLHIKMATFQKGISSISTVLEVYGFSDNIVEYTNFVGNKQTNKDTDAVVVHNGYSLFRNIYCILNFATFFIKNSGEITVESSGSTFCINNEKILFWGSSNGGSLNQFQTYETRNCLIETNQATPIRTISETIVPTNINTIGKTHERTISETVDPTISYTLEQTLEETISETVDPTISYTLEQTLEETISETVDPTISYTLEQTLEETISETVDPTISYTLEKTLEETISETVDPTISYTLEQTLEETISETVDPTISYTLEQTLEETISETVDPTISYTLEQTLEETISETVDPTISYTLEQTLEETISETLGPSLRNTMIQTLVNTPLKSDLTMSMYQSITMVDTIILETISISTLTKTNSNTMISYLSIVNDSMVEFYSETKIEIETKIVLFSISSFITQIPVNTYYLVFFSISETENSLSASMVISASVVGCVVLFILGAVFVSLKKNDENSQTSSSSETPSLHDLTITTTENTTELLPPEDTINVDDEWLRESV